VRRVSAANLQLRRIFDGPLRVDLPCRGGSVIPVGLNAANAGFDIGAPTVLNEIYVGGGPFDFTVH
jgi:hypothetical protein